MTEIRRATGPDEVAAALAVRHIVFVVEQRVPPELEYDGLDGDADHLVALESGRVVGTCRLLYGHDTATTKLGRMAVERPARRRGVAAALLREAEELALQAGDRRIVLDAQLGALGVYERAGYVAHGDVFLDAGIEHRRMTKELAAP